MVLGTCETHTSALATDAGRRDPLDRTHVDKASAFAMATHVCAALTEFAKWTDPAYGTSTRNR